MNECSECGEELVFSMVPARKPVPGMPHIVRCNKCGVGNVVGNRVALGTGASGNRKGHAILASGNLINTVAPIPLLLILTMTSLFLLRMNLIIDPTTSVILGVLAWTVAWLAVILWRWASRHDESEAPA